MINGLKRRLFLNHIEKRKIPLTRSNSSSILSNYNRVGVLISEEDCQDSEFKKLFKGLVNKAEICDLFKIGFKPNKETTDPLYFGISECNWFGVPQSAAIDAFVNREYDLLIVCLRQDSTVLEYIASLTQAKFIIGPNFKSLTDKGHLLFDLPNQFSFSVFKKQFQQFVPL